MRRILTVVVALGLVVGLMFPVSAQAWGRGGGGHFRGGHFQGGHFFGGFAAGVFTGALVGSAFAPAYAYPAPVYAYPAPVYAYPAPVYVAPPPPAPPAYWYYCRSAGAYYPYVASCPEPWEPVPAR